MAKAKKKDAKGKADRLTDILKEMLGKHADAEMLQATCPELLKGLANGMKMPTFAELLAHKLMQLAMAKDPPRWVIELILDRTEGRVVQGAPPQEGEGQLHKKLDDIDIELINSQTAEFAQQGDLATEAGADAGAENVSDGPSARLLDLSGDGAGGSQGAGGEPALAAVSS